MCVLLGIEKTRTTPYHPKSDGMVERFNRTLEAMLSAYVSDHQRDWDSHLPYAMMAYRSAEHETTTLTPNVLMLSRETSTPMDLMYEMPSSIKMKPANMWVWELRERLEDAHRIVRKYALGSMLRRETYHDRKSYWERLQVRDVVYVLFPKHKIGCSPTFTSFWRGPFTVQRIITDVLYEVDCGREARLEIIHCDRMRKKPSQELDHESTDLSRTAVEEEVLPSTVASDKAETID
jgi:hypothetical protein